MGCHAAVGLEMPDLWYAGSYSLGSLLEGIASVGAVYPNRTGAYNHAFTL
jgi:hypothetical protein